MDITFRPALAADTPFLTEMLAAAASWRPEGPTASIDTVSNTLALARYVSDWPQSGDLGVIAEIEEPIGAAWLRYFTDMDPSYGFIDAATPELSMGVVARCRSRGVGRRLLQVLLSAARSQGIQAVSLSVDPDNYARQLYQGLGFESVCQPTSSITMRLQL
ncbi:GNAT family N-acetyltransferase [Tessaracoccus antarcticus]|nr:GNAT family N-acetyltransferase [Tessaracoccus antarcticus]